MRANGGYYRIRQLRLLANYSKKEKVQAAVKILVMIVIMLWFVPLFAL
jgi:hypothetical protein